MPMTFAEMCDRVTFATQLAQETGPVVLINTFTVAADDVDRFLTAWTRDAAFMKEQPGFVSTQLHRGVAGSTAFVNVAMWESAQSLRAAVASPQFRSNLASYPSSAVAMPPPLPEGGGPGDLRPVAGSGGGRPVRQVQPTRGRRSAMFGNLKLSNKRLRDAQRIIHLIGALLLATYLYAPGGDGSLFATLVRVVVVPVLVATGLAMWQLPRLRQRLTGHRRIPRQNVRASHHSAR